MKFYEIKEGAAKYIPGEPSQAGTWEACAKGDLNYLFFLFFDGGILVPQLGIEPMFPYSGECSS